LDHKLEALKIIELVEQSDTGVREYISKGVKLGFAFFKKYYSFISDFENQWFPKKLFIFEKIS